MTEAKNGRKEKRKRKEVNTVGRSIPLRGAAIAPSVSLHHSAIAQPSPLKTCRTQTQTPPAPHASIQLCRMKISTSLWHFSQCYRAIAIVHSLADPADPAADPAAASAADGGCTAAAAGGGAVPPAAAGARRAVERSRPICETMKMAS